MQTEPPPKWDPGNVGLPTNQAGVTLKLEPKNWGQLWISIWRLGKCTLQHQVPSELEGYGLVNVGARGPNDGRSSRNGAAPCEAHVLPGDPFQYPILIAELPAHIQELMQRLDYQKDKAIKIQHMYGTVWT